MKKIKNFAINATLLATFAATTIALATWAIILLNAPIPQ